MIRIAATDPVSSPAPADAPAGPRPAPALPGADRIGPRAPADALAAFARRPAAEPPLRHAVRGPSVALAASPERVAALAAGAHQIRCVDGRALAFPSQDLTRIESDRPDDPGQTHALERHVGTSLADNLARLAGSPLLRAAGGYGSIGAAQFATDRTIANPANQAAIGRFLDDPERLKFALERVDLGRPVGSSTLQRDVADGHPHLILDRTATVVLIKDRTFPEGYRILTTYPDTRRPEVDPEGHPLP